MTKDPPPIFASNPAKDHERYLAGAALRGLQETIEIQRLLRLEDFADFASRLIVKTAFDLVAESRHPDLESAWLLLKSRGQTADLGHDPVGFLAEIFEKAPTGANIEHAAGVVREWSVRRQVLALASVLSLEAGNPSGSAEELVATAERGLRDIAENSVDTGPIHIREAIETALLRYDNPRPAAITTTGVPELDSCLSGGFRPGELVLIGARPGIGKSAVSLSFASAAGRAGIGALFFSLEMSQDELTDRFLASETGVPLTRLRSGKRLDDRDAEKIATTISARSLVKFPIWFDYRPRLTVGQIAATVRRHVRRHQIKFVVVDYLQLIAPEDKRAPRHEQVGAISRALKLLAKDAGVTIFAAAQLNREGDSNERPKLSQLRESGSLEQDADVVFLLHVTETDASRPVWDVDLILAKQRNGPSGVDIKLELHRPIAKFTPRILV